jgi:hypothetical protein
LAAQRVNHAYELEVSTAKLAAAALKADAFATGHSNVQAAWRGMVRDGAQVAMAMAQREKGESSFFFVSVDAHAKWTHTLEKKRKREKYQMKMRNDVSASIFVCFLTGTRREEEAFRDLLSVEAASKRWAEVNGQNSNHLIGRGVRKAIVRPLNSTTISESRMQHRFDGDYDECDGGDHDGGGCGAYGEEGGRGRSGGGGCYGSRGSGGSGSGGDSYSFNASHGAALNGGDGRSGNGCGGGGTYGDGNSQYGEGEAEDGRNGDYKVHIRGYDYGTGSGQPSGMFGKNRRTEFEKNKFGKAKGSGGGGGGGGRRRKRGAASGGGDVMDGVIMDLVRKAIRAHCFSSLSPFKSLENPTTHHENP